MLPFEKGRRCFVNITEPSYPSETSPGRNSSVQCFFVQISSCFPSIILDFLLLCRGWRICTRSYSSCHSVEAWHASCIGAKRAFGAIATAGLSNCGFNYKMSSTGDELLIKDKYRPYNITHIVIVHVWTIVQTGNHWVHDMCTLEMEMVSLIPSEGEIGMEMKLPVYSQACTTTPFAAINKLTLIKAYDLLVSHKLGCSHIKRLIHLRTEYRRPGIAHRRPAEQGTVQKTTQGPSGGLFNNLSTSLLCIILRYVRTESVNIPDIFRTLLV